MVSRDTSVVSVTNIFSFNVVVVSKEGINTSDSPMGNYIDVVDVVLPSQN